MALIGCLATDDRSNIRRNGHFDRCGRCIHDYGHARGHGCNAENTDRRFLEFLDPADYYWTAPDVVNSWTPSNRNLDRGGQRLNIERPRPLPLQDPRCACVGIWMIAELDHLDLSAGNACVVRRRYGLP